MKSIFIILIFYFISCDGNTDVDDNQNIKSAKNSFIAEDYEKSERLYEALINNKNTEISAQAYVGLGFSQLRLEKFDKSFSTFANGEFLDNNSYENDIKTGLAILEYHQKYFYIQSIQHSLEILSDEPDFILELDPNINYMDIRLILARSYFDTQQYSKCLEQVKIMGKMGMFSPSSDYLVENLLYVLQELTIEHK